MAKKQTIIMCKIKYSSKNSTPFGGLNCIHDVITRSGLKLFLNTQSIRAKYSNADVVMALLFNSLVPWEYIANLQVLKRKAPESVSTHISSADTIEYICKQLQTPTETRTTGCS